MNDINAHTAPAAPRIFNLFLSALMIIMGVVGVLGLIFGLGFMLSDGFYNWAFQNIEISTLNDSSNAGESRQTLVLSAFSGAIISGAFFFIAMLLKKLLATLLAGDPFVPENINRLRKIWIILAIAEAFRTIVSPMIAMMDPSNTMSFDLDIRFTSWFLVFVIATVAEVFRHGAELRQEQKLTI